MNEAFPRNASGIGGDYAFLANGGAFGDWREGEVVRAEGLAGPDGAIAGLDPLGAKAYRPSRTR